MSRKKKAGRIRTQNVLIFISIFFSIINYRLPAFSSPILEQELIQSELFSNEDFSKPITLDAAKTTLISIAEEKLKQGQFNQALQYASTIIKTEPENLSANGVLGVIYAFTGQKDKAISILSFLKKHADRNFYTQLIRAILNAQEGKIKLAKLQIKKSIEAEPNHPFAVYYEGSLLLSQKLYNQAVEHFKKTLEIRSEFTPAIAGLAQAYLQLNRNDQAILYFKRAIASEPENLMYRKQLLELYNATGQKEIANQQIKEMLYHIPGVKQNYLNQGKQLLIIGQYKKAIQKMDQIIPHYKEISPAHLIKATAYSNLGETGKAEESLEIFITSQRNNPIAHHYAGMCYMAIEDFKKAEQQFTRVISLNPRFGRSFIPLTIIAQIKGDSVRAIEGLKIAKEQRESAVLIDYLSAHIFLQMDDLDNYLLKIESGAKIIQGLDKNHVFFIPEKKTKFAENRNLMILFFLNGWYGKTLKISNELLASNKNDPFSLYYSGLSQTAQNKFKGAIESYRKLLKIDPLIYSVYMKLGDLYLKTNQLEDAAHSFNKVLEINPRFTPAYISLADLYAGNQNIEEAAEYYEKAIKINGRNVEPYAKLLLLLSEKETELSKAKQYCEHLETLSPSDPYSFDAMGWVYLKLKKQEKALGLIQKAYHLSPNDPLILYHMGIVSYKMKQMKSAKKFLTASVKQSSNFLGVEHAKQILKELEN